MISAKLGRRNLVRLSGSQFSVLPPAVLISIINLNEQRFYNGEFENKVENDFAILKTTICLVSQLSILVLVAILFMNILHNI